MVQTAEQLVKVPEFVQLAALFQQQMVDAPGSPQSFLPGLFVTVGADLRHSSSSRSWRSGWSGVFKVSHQERIQQCFVEQNTLTFQFLKVVAEGEVFSVYDPNPAASSRHSPGAADGGFSHFSPGEKSAKLGPHSGSELSADFTSWTLAACGVPMVPEPVPEVESEEGYLDKWEVVFCTTPLMAWSGGTSPCRAGVPFSFGSFLPVVVQRQVLGRLQLSFSPSSCVSPRRLLLYFLHALFTLGNCGTLFPPGFVSGSYTSCVWVLHEEYRKNEFSNDSVVIRAMLGSTVNTCSGSV